MMATKSGDFIEDSKPNALVSEQPHTKFNHSTISSPIEGDAASHTSKLPRPGNFFDGRKMIVPASKRRSISRIPPVTLSRPWPNNFFHERKHIVSESERPSTSTAFKPIQQMKKEVEANKGKLEKEDVKRLAKREKRRKQLEEREDRDRLEASRDLPHASAGRAGMMKDIREEIKRTELAVTALMYRKKTEAENVVLTFAWHFVIAKVLDKGFVALIYEQRQKGVAMVQIGRWATTLRYAVHLLHHDVDRKIHLEEQGSLIGRGELNEPHLVVRTITQTKNGEPVRPDDSIDKLEKYLSRDKVQFPVEAPGSTFDFKSEPLCPCRLCVLEEIE